MKKIDIQSVKFIAGMIVFLVSLAVVGTMDYREAVITSMSKKAYNIIVDKVGTSEKAIVEEYELNREYYDSITF